jgi:hypothetical protein
MKCVMSLRSLQSMKKETHPSTPTPMFDAILAVSSLRHAGIQAPRMRPDTSMSTWVPAVHARTTSSYNDYVTYTNLMAIVLHPTKFSKEFTKFKSINIQTLRVLLGQSPLRCVLYG